ncbi:MAG: TonB-dependent receptor [Sulfuricurvum sp.]|uniref:TonB-dependent receptor plug domain-containing protein n=1 Tax=Sulfuricurvum sp. TaxID=2025608 RepID=UPI0025E55041|nr:TonB-dependent receptor [Sulfuricurvum sp.]MCK9371896.1 TonB-dependent receptor [Sulfuricurvum sp.]
MDKYTLSLIGASLLMSPLCAHDITLDPIMVSASKTEQSLSTITANATVITAEELEEKHIATVAEALNLVSGISTISNGGVGKSTSVFVRGFDSKRVLVLIDGIRYNDPTGLNGAPYEHLMVTDIERIEIIKGAQSGVWGADASAGVINILTKSAQNGLHGAITGEYGTFNTQKYGATASYATDTYYVKAASTTVDTDGFSAQAPKGVDITTLEDDGYRNTTTSLSAGYKFDSMNKIDLKHTAIHATTESDPYNNPNGIYNSIVEESFSSLNVNHIDSFNEINLYAKHSSFERDYPQDLYTKAFDGVVTEYGLSSRIPYRSKNDFVLIGADTKSFEHRNDFDKKYTNTALFMTNSNTFNGRTTLTESVRQDNYDAFHDKTTGKIGVKHFLDNGFYLSSNYGTAYNIPTVYNLYGPYGSTTITPESTKSFDASVGYKGVVLTYFYNTIEDMIDFDMSTYKYNNIRGTSTFKGFEAEYKKEFLSKTLLSLNYTRLSAKDKDGFDLARRANENFKFGIDYYGIEKLHVGVFGEYVGSRYDDKEQTRQTGRYTLTNAVVNYDLSKTVSLYTKIDNITDKYYQSVHGYATSSRAWYAGLKVSF